MRSNRSKILPGAAFAPSASQHSGLLDLLAKFGGALAGLTLVALVMGRSELHGYFGHLGAPWVIPLMSPSRLISASFYPFYYCFGGWVLLGVLSTAQKSDVIKFTPAILFGFACMIGVASGVSYTKFPGWEWSRFVGISSISIGAAGAFFLYQRAIVERKKFGGPHYFLVMTVVLALGIVGPNFLGRDRAKNDIRGRYVQLADTFKPKRIWHLVTALDTGFLLAAVDEDRYRLVFRIVSSSEMGEVRTFIADIPQ